MSSTCRGMVDSVGHEVYQHSFHLVGIDIDSIGSISGSISIRVTLRHATEHGVHGSRQKSVFNGSSTHISHEAKFTRWPRCLASEYSSSRLALCVFQLEQPLDVLEVALQDSQWRAKVMRNVAICRRSDNRSSETLIELNASARNAISSFEFTETDCARSPEASRRAACVKSPRSDNASRRRADRMKATPRPANAATATRA